MKLFTLALSFLIMASACFAPPAKPKPAEAPTCSTQVFTEAGTEYNVQPGDCILRADSSTFGYIRFRLPISPSVGDSYTFQSAGVTQTEHYEYFDEEYQQWVSGDSTYTGGMGVLSLTDALVGDASELWTATPGYQVKATFDGTNWTLIEGTFTP